MTAGSDDLSRAMARVRLLVLDVDGVLTDGGLWIDGTGGEFKRFDVRDGLGIRLWIASGGLLAAISGRGGASTRLRLGELGVECVMGGVKDKVAAVEGLLASHRLEWSAVAMIGDDLPDLPVLRRCGLPIAVADGCGEVRSAASIVTARGGGHGAVREAIERILRSQGRWEEMIRTISERGAG